MSDVEEVIQLLRLLSLDLQQNTLSPPCRLSALERLKILGRSAQNTEPISDANGIKTLATIGLKTQADDASREALRCLANILLLKPLARRTFVDLDFAGAVAERLNAGGYDDEFLCSRILFLLTYETNLDILKIVKDNGLDVGINQRVARHCGALNDTAFSKQTTGDTNQEMALCETLKLLFNLAHNYPSIAPNFIPCVGSIMEIIRSKAPFSGPPLQPPMNHLVNALLIFDYITFAHDALFPESCPTCNVELLVEILDSVTLQYPAAALDMVAVPLITIIRRAYEAAPPPVRRFMQNIILPTNEDREQPLGKGKSLSSRLLRLSTSTQISNMKDSISHLIFELSERNADVLVHNIGYGYAAGYLASHDLAIPDVQTLTSDSPGALAITPGGHVVSDNSSPNSARNIDFVTGQYLDKERTEEGIAMTEEEKLREAEKLFILFERLKRTGVINVQNPVQAAIDSGRFKELN